MCPSQALQGGGCVSDFLHSQSPREPPRTHCFRPLAPPNPPHHTLSKACSLAPDPPSTWHSIEMSSLLRERFFKQTYVTSSSSSSSLHCVLLSRIEFYVSCRFAISKYPKYLTAARLLGQSQSSRGDKDNLSKSTTGRVQIYMYNGALLLWQNRSSTNIQERSFQYPAPWKMAPRPHTQRLRHWRCASPLGGHTYYHDNHVEIGQKYVDE